MLNEPQIQAVQHVAGPRLVFAGAGSGKTRTIIYRIANLLARERVAPYRILAVTFTNKAAGEMRSRIEQLAGPALARDLWVGTFHATSARLLRRYCDEVGLKRNFVIYDESDQKALMNRLIKSKNLSDREYPPRLVFSRIHSKKQESLLPEQIKRTSFRRHHAGAVRRLPAGALVIQRRGFRGPDFARHAPQREPRFNRWRRVAIPF